MTALRKKSERDSYASCLIMAITCDLAISASMVYFLNKMRTGFKKLNSRVHSREMLDTTQEIQLKNLDATTHGQISPAFCPFVRTLV
ncbi:hypothetical protein DXG01_004456 [Tephrocybe rancida]|nr:hypothetical protein DXG01_004456 [Tephrocybe rancida]